jgi:hypothetical protein
MTAYIFCYDLDDKCFYPSCANTFNSFVGIPIDAALIEVKTLDDVWKPIKFLCVPRADEHDHMHIINSTEIAAIRYVAGNGLIPPINAYILGYYIVISIPI